MNQTNDFDFIDLPLLIRGKVRNVYDLGDSLLMVASDRMSAFDVVFDEAIPEKGKVLTSVSAFWFEYTKDTIPNHVISTDPKDFPMGLSAFADRLKGRSMWVKKVDMLPCECIVRGYLEGSALKEYREKGTVSGVVMPEGMRQGDKLPAPMFTPSTKVDEGHDINITYVQLEELLGKEDARLLSDTALSLYNKASEYALSRGIILADTKFEFGKIDGVLTVADEIFTPDSSRFWDLADYEPGRAQKSFDKQPLRDWLETLDWNKQYPAPHLPEDVINKTAERYRSAYKLLTGKELE